MSSPSNPRCGSTCVGASARQRERHAAEQRALDYLTAHGLRPVARNFRVRVGELDLVLAFSCTARSLEAERKRTRDALDRTYATAPVFGFDSFGEQFGPLLVNHTLVALALGVEAQP